MATISTTLLNELTKTLIREEGIVLNAYPDPPGNNKNQYAIGIGHLIKPEEIERGYLLLENGRRVPVRGTGGFNTILTRSDAESLFKVDIQFYIKATQNVVPSSTWNALTDKQKTALVSYTYNTGPGGFSNLYNSTTNGFKQALESGNYVKAGEILRDAGIRTADGRVLPVLIDRRKREGELIAQQSLPASSAPTNTSPTSAQNNTDDYFKKTYVQPMQSINSNIVDIMKVGAESFQQYTTKTAVATTLNLEGEKALLSGAESIVAEIKEKTNSILSRVGGFLPSEQYFLVYYNLFEFYPDKMRAKMSANAEVGINSNYSHAWRAPGKLAITANVTIPGCSGFRIGEIFWIGRTYDTYKRFGAFQLFGLTETIDINRGWTTQLYSRFNAMPEAKLLGIKSE